VAQQEPESKSLFDRPGDTPAPTPGPQKASSGLSLGAKIAIVMALVVVVVIVVALKNSGSASGPKGGSSATGVAPADAASPSPKALPRLIELGSVTCIPCRMMTPILDELRREYAGALQVDFIDVHKDREAAARFGIRVIPTQVFLAADGTELFRHEGFFPKADILAKWKDVGVELVPSAPSRSQ